MATPNAETIQGFYEAANRGDLESIRAMLDPEVEWRWPPHGLADRDVFRGPDEFIAGMLQWREAWG